MRPSRSTLISALAAAAALLAGAAQAEPLPRPQVDYAASGTLAGRGTILVRHHAGKLRVDLKIDGLPGHTMGLVDLNTHRAVMTLPVPGSKIAVETDFGADARFGQIAGEGTRTGASTVAGEACDVWQIKVPKVRTPATACITADGITLRTEVAVSGKGREVMEIKKLSRAPQDAALFALPPGTNVVKASAMKNLLRSLPGLLHGGQ